MKRALYWAVVTVAVVALGGCCKRVLVPPLVDLKQNEVVGIIEFRLEEQGKLSGYATSRFLRAITKDQPGVQIVELGKETDVLAAVGHSSLTPDAIKAIGEKYGLNGLIVGTIEISDIQPHFEFGLGLPHASASARVKATLTARLVRTDNAATVWTGTAQSERTVGQVTVAKGFFSFDADDPERAYGELINDLVNKSTRDFRNRWKCVRRK